MRIGVVADTHISDRGRMLPPKVLESLSAVDIVLHAGDIARLEVLQQLQEQVSLTFAVFGDADPPEVRKFLQDSQVLEFAGCRIGLIHGHRDGRLSLGRRLREFFDPAARRQGVQDTVLEKLHGVDAIVYGHTHEPFAKMINGIYLFNPGSPMPGVRNGPTIGLLEVTPRGISGRIVKI